MSTPPAPSAPLLSEPPDCCSPSSVTLDFTYLLRSDNLATDCGPVSASFTKVLTLSGGSYVGTVATQLGTTTSITLAPVGGQWRLTMSTMGYSCSGLGSSLFPTLRGTYPDIIVPRTGGSVLCLPCPDRGRYTGLVVS
jgi:hypothetical protein